MEKQTLPEAMITKTEKTLKHSIFCFLILTVICITISMINGLNIVSLLFFFEGLMCTYFALIYGREVHCTRWRRKMLEWQESKRRVEMRFGKFDYDQKGH
jgi:hypothetical protein